MTRSGIWPWLIAAVFVLAVFNGLRAGGML